MYCTCITIKIDSRLYSAIAYVRTYRGRALPIRICLSWQFVFWINFRILRFSFLDFSDFWIFHFGLFLDFPFNLEGHL